MKKGTHTRSQTDRPTERGLCSGETGVPGACHAKRTVQQQQLEYLSRTHLKAT